ncbi:MAG TPA: zinc ribbon domain-containing protein [Verrucomicrobiae bacterium]
MPAPETCPNCGEDVPRNAKACPECGADESSGWSETAYASNLDLPLSDEEFDYEEYKKREFGHATRPNGLAWYWWLTALILLILIAFAFLR